MRKCSHCGAPLDNNALFCTSCGTKQEVGWHCIHCGAPIDADSIFCTSCGSRQDGNRSQMNDLNETPSQPKYASTQNTSACDDKHSSRKWFYVIGGILFATLLGGGLYLLWNKKMSSGEFAGKPITKLFPEVQKASNIGTIPDSPMIYKWEVSPGEECDGDVTVVRKSDENQMVIMYATCSCDANTLRLGVYQNGQYVFYYELLVGNLEYDETKNGISLKADSPERIFYNGYYGKDMATDIKHDWGIEHQIDWNKVSEAQLTDIFQNALNEGPQSTPFILTYNEIKAKIGDAMDSNDHSLNYKVCMPNIKKFVTITKNTVSVLESPNINSKKIQTVSKEMPPTALAVIGESGEWYKVYYYDRSGRYEYDSAIGYMMKKYCEEIPLEPVTEEMLQNIVHANISICNQDKYKELCFEWNEFTSDGMIEGPLYIGKVVKGMWVFDRMLPTVKGDAFQVSRSNASQKGGINWQLVYDKSLRYNDMAGLDCKKLEEANITYLLQNAEKMEKYDSHIFYCFKKDKHEINGETFWEWSCLYYNPQDFGNEIVEK